MVEQDPETRALTDVVAALAPLADADARRRVLTYAWNRFLPDGVPTAAATHAPSPPATVAASPSSSASPHEIPGIASLDANGDLRITVRDLKARSGLDAAVRLAHIAIFAHQRLKDTGISSSKGLTPILKHWRLYDGNTRKRLSDEKGIVRTGDLLTLDAHARQAAEKFIADALDDTVEGRWKPRARKGG
jgi:hypothetical protein